MTSPAVVSSAPTAAPPRGGRTSAAGRPAWLPELLWVALTAAVAVVVAVIDLELWNMSASVPLYSEVGDAGFQLAAIKDVLETGWFTHNPRLASPFGQESFDFAAVFGDLAHYGVIWTMGLFTDNAVLVYNAFFVLCFPLIAVSAYGVMRDLGTPRAIALVGGVLFAFLPYHLLRNQQHLMLSAYYAVPLGTWLVIALAEGRTLLDRLRWRRTAVTVAVCLLVASASNYYAVFTMLVLLCVVPVAALAWRSWRIALQGGGVLAVVLAMFLLAHAPSIVYSMQEGTNQQVGSRTAIESELYGLKLTHMLIPRPGHRLEFMSLRGQFYENSTPARAEGFKPSLGSVATLGLIGAVLVFFMTGLGSRTASLRRRRISIAGASAIVCFAIGTIGGGGAIIAWQLTTQIRNWNRLSIVIAFAALLAAALLLSALYDRMRARGLAWAFGIVLAVVGVGGILDQTAPGDGPHYEAVAASWRVDRDFVRGIDARLRPNAMVLQLPHVPYPETGNVNGTNDYDHFKGYFHSSDLRWSYGAVKGRPADWQGATGGLSTEALAVASIAAGFRGVYVDQVGYTDGGAAVRAALSKLVAPADQTLSAGGRLAFYDLSPAAARLKATTTPAQRTTLSDALLRPPTIEYEAGFSFPEVDAGLPYRSAGRDAVLKLVNARDQPRRVRFTAALAGATAQPSTITVTLPGGRRETVVATKDLRSVDYELEIPPGGAEIRFQTEGPAAPTTPTDTRDKRLRVVVAQLVDSLLEDKQIAFAVRAASL